MVIEAAEISLLGNRQENQDRVRVVKAAGAALLIAVDGMGGHAHGARAAELTVEVLEKIFLAQQHPIFDAQGFLHLAIGKAHAAVVRLGANMPIESRPRATCALCLVQDDSAYWAHIGDSRIYQLRDGKVLDQTRDHSHIEVLLYDGAITREQLASHPMRNYVECCLGGDAELPKMSISRRKALQQDDVLLVCTDGFWSPLAREHLVGLGSSDGSIDKNLRALASIATQTAAPHSDNTSAAALRFSSSALRD